MGYARIYELLEKEYRTMLLALVLIFPMAYADCWKLSVSFPNLELIPQVILALAVADILMFGGFVLNIIYLISTDRPELVKKINIAVLIMPTIPSSATVIVGGIDSILCFCIIFVGFTFVCLLRPLFKIIKKLKKDGASKGHNKNEDA